MDLEYVPLSDFTHDGIRAREGVPLPPGIGASLAGELERAGLIRVRLVVKRGVPLGNPRPGGEVLPLSVSLPGQASPQTTAPRSILGLPKNRSFVK